VAKKLVIQLALLLSLVAIFVAPMWARKFALTGSARVPAASGEVETKTDHNGNTQVDLKVGNLAKPGALTPPATAYVVWFRMEGADPQNEGVLRIDDHLKGEFRTRTPWKVFDVSITAESDPAVKVPTDEGVLRTRVQP
jgi:hypothetical protein